ncbi:MAG: hypothetical protein FJW30_17565 [Acidobacteria bacterium]|nr:hypothetical protein [Acidobacteriota bacterium]
MRLIAALVLCSIAAFAQPVRGKAKEYAEKMGRGEGTLQPGSLAPDFTLRKSKSEASVTLSSFRGKRPVALLFGSYT